MNFAKAAAFSLTLLASGAWAQPAGGPPGGDRPPMSAELKAAFEACQAQGKPGDAAAAGKPASTPGGAKKKP